MPAFWVSGANASGAAAGFFPAGTNFPVQVPAGVQNGDLLIAEVHMSAAGTSSAPAGWTPLATRSLMTWWWRIASGEPASYNFTSSATQFGWGGSMASWRSSAATPIDVTSTHHVDTFGAEVPVTITLPTITSTVAGVEILYCGRRGAVAAVNTGWTFPGGFTSRLAGTGYGASGICDRPIAISTATGARAVTYTNVATFSSLFGLHLVIADGPAGGQGARVLRHASPRVMTVPVGGAQVIRHGR